MRTNIETKALLRVITTALLFSCPLIQAEEPILLPPPEPQPTQPVPFAFATVENLAKELSTKPYEPSERELPEDLKQLTSEGYRDIQFRFDQSVWAKESLPFRLQLFHRGFLYKDRVRINVIENGKITPLVYKRELFDFGKNQFADALDQDIGFSGFKILNSLRKDSHFDEISVFQGASYFRSVGIGQAYGISSRGIAIDTGLTQAEEFPIFKEFWIEKPAPDATQISVYALLDGPSVTGAYRFNITPQVNVNIEVQAKIYLRNGVTRFGIAPLTSMYLFGENSERNFDDYRPEVHDSDGLLITMNNAENIWRPLNNPKRLAVSVFSGTDIRGFGLLQRDRNFDNYQDLDAMYHIRPSAWVEPSGNWGEGSVYLIEIPSDAEKYDNIVAFWEPKISTNDQREWAYNYKIHYQLAPVTNLELAQTIATRVGGRSINPDDPTRRQYVIDFVGDTLSSLSTEAPVEAVVTCSSGKIENIKSSKNALNGGWRLAFEFIPDQNQNATDMRAFLKIGQQTLTETWTGQWTKIP